MAKGKSKAKAKASLSRTRSGCEGLFQVIFELRSLESGDVKSPEQSFELEVSPRDQHSLSGWMVHVETEMQIALWNKFKIAGS